VVLPSTMPAELLMTHQGEVCVQHPSLVAVTKNAAVAMMPRSSCCGSCDMSLTSAFRQRCNAYLPHPHAHHSQPCHVLAQPLECKCTSLGQAQAPFTGTQARHADQPQPHINGCLCTCRDLGQRMQEAWAAAM
jgi:hypothetical protein